MNESLPNNTKRAWLIATSCAGAVGAGFAAVPFVASLQPSARARAAGAAVDVEIAALAPGEKITIDWRGKPVWILKRTAEQITSLDKTESLVADPRSVRVAYPTPGYAQNQHRSIKPEVFVAIGICTHLGCSPVDRLQPGSQPPLPKDWQGGFLCPCHGSTFDLAGRVFRNKPAPDNLEVPPHTYLSASRLRIGDT